MKAKHRPMIMDTFDIKAGEDLVEIGLMDCGPDGLRPEVDGPILNITVPLSQLGPLMGSLREALESPDLAGACSRRLAASVS